MARTAVEDLNKLPIWAREKIINLSRQTKELEEELTQLKTQPESKITIDTFGASPREMYLPNQSKIKFHFDQDGYKMERYIDVAFGEAFNSSPIADKAGWNQNAVVRISSSIDTLLVTPHASNVIYVEMKRKAYQG